MKRNLLVMMLLLTMIIIFASFSFAEVKNPDTIIYVATNNPTTMSPPYTFSGSSVGVLSNIYENLIDFKGGSVTEFIPVLSTEVPSIENGLISEDGLTYTFPIREGVKFQNGDILTPEDVEYSFEQSLIYDRAGGPSLLLLKPLCGVTGIEKLAIKLTGVEKYSDLFEDGDPRVGELKSEYKEAMVKVYTDYVDKAVEVNGNKVVFHLYQPYSPLLSILAPYFSGYVLDKKWAIEQGTWDGKEDTWWKYHDIICEEDPLFNITNGTGPYILKKWMPGEIIILERFDNYWQGPAKIKNVQIKYIGEWTTRKLMLQEGDADMVVVPSQNLEEVETMEGVRTIKGLPGLRIRVGLMPWEINTEGNSLVGSGKLDGEGIPPDFFSDIHVRKAFSYLFPYEIFLEKVGIGQAMRVPGPILKGLFGYSDDPSLFYNHDLNKAIEEFKLAWDGQVWEKGFKFTAIHAGSVYDKGFLDIISSYAKMINPKFEITTRRVQWSAFLKLLLSEQLALSSSGYGVDFPDPINLLEAYLSSYGPLSAFLGDPYLEFAKENIDPLIDKAARSTDPEEIAKVYKQLVKISHDQAINIYYMQEKRSHVERTWIHGWIYNPLTDNVGIDFYGLSKDE